MIAGQPHAQVASPSAILPSAGVRLGANEARSANPLPRSAPAPSAEPPAPDWLVTFGLGVGEEFTDNANYAPSARADAITLVTPSIAVRGATPRLEVSATYNPTVSLYARDGSQSRISHSFAGTALATLVPDTLFLDARGFVTTQSILGGRALTGNATLNRQDEATSLSFALSPYAQHRFGSLGTGAIALSFARNEISGGSTASPTLPFLSAARVVSTATTSEGIRLGFETGEDFGRTLSAILLSATRFDGTGSLQNAYRLSFTDDVTYALTRRVAVTARLGYQDLRYATVPEVRVHEPVWGVGVRLTPTPDSTVLVRYGREDGGSNLTLDAAYAVTARMRLTARYSEGLTTDVEDLQNAIASAAIDPYGNTVDRDNGGPILPVNAFFGVQTGVYRLKRFSLVDTVEYDRDVLMLSVERQSRTLVGAPAGSGATAPSDEGTYGGASWAHELSPVTRASLGFQYGVRHTASAGAELAQDAQVLGVGLGFRWQLGKRLAATAQYDFARLMPDAPAQGVTVNTVFFGLQASL